MKTDLENLDNVEDMLDLISSGLNDKEINPSFSQELQILQLQTFLMFFAKYKEFSNSKKEDLEANFSILNGNTNGFQKQSALIDICELFFPENQSKTINRKNNSEVCVTPCEDCMDSPTHLIEFRDGNRTEEHFLCESCEQLAIKE